MSCLNCESTNLHASAAVAEWERTGLLTDVKNFELCRSCGNVMFRKLNGELASTQDIKDNSIIALAYSKIFSANSSFKGTPPSHYGYTQNGKMHDTSGLEKKAPAVKPAVIEEPIVQEEPKKSYITFEEDPAVVETYQHVDNSEPKLSIFGKFAVYVEKTFQKIFKKAS